MDENNVANDAPARVNVKGRQKILIVWIVFFLTIGFGVITWKLYQVQNQILALGSDLDTFTYNTARDLTSLDNDLHSLRTATASDISSINSDLYRLSSDLSSINSNLYQLSSDLSSVAAVANNANRWAHSHTYSDARLKSELTPIGNPLSKLLMLKGGYFTWNETAKKLYNLDPGSELGVLAQDVEVVFPELVYTDVGGYKQVDYSRLTVVLIEAIREQQVQIQMLEKQIMDVEHTGNDR